MASIETKLERLSKEELIALIWRMIERHADLELLVELTAAETQLRDGVGRGTFRRKACASGDDQPAVLPGQIRGDAGAVGGCDGNDRGGAAGQGYVPNLLCIHTPVERSGRRW